MADAPDTASYITRFNESVTLPNSRQLDTGDGLTLEDAGSGQTLTVNTSGFLNSVATAPSNGFLVKTGTTTAAQRTITGDDTVTVVNPDGVSGNVIIGVNNNTSIQQVQASLNGTLVGSGDTLNFIPGAGAGVNVHDSGNSIDITFTASGSGAPSDATYITQTPNSSLSNEQALSSLSTGLLKVTNGTGVLSTAVAGTDYQSASSNLTDIAGLTPSEGSMIVGDGASWTARGIGANGTVPTSNGSDWSWQPGGTGGAPIDAAYWVSQDNGTLTDEINIGGLTTGLLKISVDANVATPSTAVAGSDYYSPGNPTTIEEDGSSLTIGTDAMGASVGGGNVVIGPEAGQNSIANFLTIVGYQAAQNLDTFNGATAIGSQAMQNATNGSTATAVGSNALTVATDCGGTVAVGNNAASTQTVYGDSLYIGNGADSTTSGLNNAGAIGSGSSVSQSNQLALGGQISSVGQQITIGMVDKFGGATNRDAALILGTDNGLNPYVYMSSISNPTAANIAANDGVYSVNAGLPKFTTSSGSLTLASNPMTTAGDIIVAGASGTPTRLGVGTNGQVLTINGGAPTWQNVSSPIIYETANVAPIVTNNGTSTVLLDYTPSSALLSLLTNTSATGWIFISASMTGTSSATDQIEYSIGTDVSIGGSTSYLQVGTGGIIPITGFSGGTDISYIVNASSTVLRIYVQRVATTLTIATFPYLLTVMYYPEATIS